MQNNYAAHCWNVFQKMMFKIRLQGTHDDVYDRCIETYRVMQVQKQYASFKCGRFMQHTTSTPVSCLSWAARANGSHTRQALPFHTRFVLKKLLDLGSSGVSYYANSYRGFLMTGRRFCYTLFRAPQACPSKT